MKKRIILKSSLLVLLTAFFIPVYPQSRPQDVKITAAPIAKQGNQVSVIMDIAITHAMDIKSNEMIILRPVLRSNKDSTDYFVLPSVVITGSQRQKIINRKNKFGGNLPFEGNPEIIIKRKNKSEQSVSYRVNIAYKFWMDDASLLIEKNVSGCANCSERVGDYLIVQNIFPDPLPQKEKQAYKLTFIIPDVEPVKARSDHHTATFNYVVNRYELVRDYKKNSHEFAEVDKVVGQIRDNKDLEITEFSISGYASPEGGSEHNRKLSENRANSFADYLATMFGIPRNKFTVKGMGEDWSGLQTAVAASSLADKQAVLDIIDKVSNPDARDAKLLKLSGGDTYNTLLKEYYPALRRTEYSVTYIVRAFNAEEARPLIRTNPKLLSLNEMYLVAETYPSTSKEFKEALDIAFRLYPESEIAIINSAAADVESGNMDAAIDRMNQIESKPSTWNNLGVAYVLKGDIEKAKEYFSKAALEGNNDASQNLNKLEKAIGGEE